MSTHSVQQAGQLGHWRAGQPFKRCRQSFKANCRPLSTYTRICYQHRQSGDCCTAQREGAAHSSSKPLEHVDAVQHHTTDGPAALLPGRHSNGDAVASLLGTTAGLWLLQALPSLAEEVDFSQGSYSTGSYIVSLGLFLVTLPGLWSLIKRAPKASVKRKTFEVDGPAKPSAVPIDQRARQIFDYFKKYNYTVKETGEVISFVGNYRASKSQAAALAAYTFVSLVSTALVLSIAIPAVGNWWYAMALVSPAAGAYYLKKADRQEEFKVKMVTEDDDSATDILCEGDVEEIERFRRELDLKEKGKVYVKGILEG